MYAAISMKRDLSTWLKESNEAWDTLRERKTRLYQSERERKKDHERAIYAEKRSTKFGARLLLLVSAVTAHAP